MTVSVLTAASLKATLRLWESMLSSAMYYFTIPLQLGQRTPDQAGNRIMHNQGFFFWINEIYSRSRANPYGATYLLGTFKRGRDETDKKGDI